MLKFFFVGLWCVGLFIQGAGLVLFLFFRSRRHRQPQSPYPRVNLIKVCYQAIDNEEENFDSCFHQDYPGELTVHFAVSSLCDPIVPIIQSYLARYPEGVGRLLVSETRRGFWKKVDALYDAHHAIEADIVIWSDSDVVMQRAYVSQMVGALQEPGISVVTTPQMDIRVTGMAGAWKSLANNADIATLVAFFDSITPYKRIGFGHSMGFWKAEFDSFGQKAWDILNRFLADDQALPYIFWCNKKRVVFRYFDCPVEFSYKTLKQVWSQKVRWLLAQKIGSPSNVLYLFGFLLYPICLSFIGLCILGHAFLPFFLCACLVRIVVSGIVEYSIGGLGVWGRYFWLIPFWDIMQVYFCVRGFFSRTFTIQGRTFRLVDRYFLEDVP